MDFPSRASLEEKLVPGVWIALSVDTCLPLSFFLTKKPQLLELNVKRRDNKIIKELAVR